MTNKLLKQFDFLQKIFYYGVNYKRGPEMIDNFLLDFRKTPFLKSNKYDYYIYLGSKTLFVVKDCIFDNCHSERDCYCILFLSRVEIGCSDLKLEGIYIKFLKSHDIDCLLCNCDTSQKLAQKQQSSRQINIETRPELYDKLEEYANDLNLTYQQFVDRIYLLINYELVKLV